jgi:hypothetical protein
VTDPTASGGPDRALILRLTGGDRSTALCLLAICQRADAEGVAAFHEVAIAYRDDHLNAMRAEGRDVEAEAGRLSVDEVRDHLRRVALPRWWPPGALGEPVDFSRADAELRIRLGDDAPGAARRRARSRCRRSSGSPASTRPLRGGRRPMAQAAVGKASVLSAHGLVKTYRKRNVVNNVQLELRQGEIVGLLGPNGAGKTTTFYMIAGPDPAERGHDQARRRRHHAHADVPARAARHRLPLAGTVDLPQAVGGGEHHGDPRDAADRPAGARAAARGAARRAEHQAPAGAARRTRSRAASVAGWRSRARW